MGGRVRIGSEATRASLLVLLFMLAACSGEECDGAHQLEASHSSPAAPSGPDPCLQPPRLGPEARAEVDRALELLAASCVSRVWMKEPCDAYVERIRKKGVVDPWGTPIRGRCKEGNLQVVSAGRDRVFGPSCARDDLVVPMPNGAIYYGIQYYGPACPRPPTREMTAAEQSESDDWWRRLNESIQ